MLRWLVSTPGVDILKFDAELFFFVLLPPIIFDAGYGVKKADIFSNLGPILCFAFIGTFITATVVCLLIWLISFVCFGEYCLSYNFTIFEAAVLASIVSAVDPVAVLGIFSEAAVDPLLNSLIFGSSVLNDAVAVVFFKTSIILVEHTLSPLLLFLTVVRFLYLSIGSVLLGLSSSLLASFVMKHVDLDRFPKLEVAIVLSWGYFTYVLCELFAFSGIIGLLIFSMAGNHYLGYNLSPVGQVSLRETLRIGAFIAETIVAIFIGLSVFALDHYLSYYTLLVAFWTTAFIALGRLTHSIILFIPINITLKLRKKRTYSLKNMVMYYFAGLRGAVALALALEYASESQLYNHDDPGNATVAARITVSATLAVVLFTSVILGGAALPLVKLLRVRSAEDVAKEVALEKNAKSLERANKYIAAETEKRYQDSATPELETSGSEPAVADAAEFRRNTLRDVVEEVNIAGVPEKQRSWFSQFDHRYLKPFFVKKSASKSKTTNLVRNLDYNSLNQYLYQIVEEEAKKVSDNDDTARKRISVSLNNMYDFQDLQNSLQKSEKGG